MEENNSTSQPLVSIILFCKNADKTIRRSTESVVNQTWKNTEYIIQDGNSTDNTLDIIREYEDTIDIQLVSEPDSGPAEAFWKALIRCRGDFIATCLADEELMPDAIENSIQIFKDKPYIGAVTGNAYLIDEEGEVLGEHIGEEFSFTRYLTGNMCPYWSSSFFSMQAFKSIGLFDYRWSDGSLEFEIWCRLAEDYEIFYAPIIFSKYGIHKNQLSNQGDKTIKEFDTRLSILSDNVFRDDGVFGNNDTFQRICILLQRLNLYRHLLAYASPQAKVVEEQIIKSGHLKQYFQHNFASSIEEVNLIIQSEKSLRIYIFITVFLLYRKIIPYSARKKVPDRFKMYIKTIIGYPAEYNMKLDLKPLLKEIGVFNYILKIFNKLIRLHLLRRKNTH